MKKTYTSRSVLHFSVGGIRIAFTPLTASRSYFDTADESLQEKIESHPWFGDKFVLKCAADTGGKAAVQKIADRETAGMREMSFATLQDAKDWLASEFGTPRSNVKKKDDAVRVGLANGVSLTIRN